MRTALVLASDCRMGAPRGALEAKLGDGAAAFLVGDANPIARFEGSGARADELQDQWRIDGERFTHSWEDRFVVAGGRRAEPGRGAAGAAARSSGAAPGDFARAALYAHDARSLAGVAKQAGFARERSQDPLIGQLGNTGAAYAPMLLAAALEQARPASASSCASYGDGAHALAFETTAALEKQRAAARRRGSPGAPPRARAATTPTCARASLDPQEWEGGADLGLSATIRFRERDADIGFVGARCTQCGQIHLPRPRVCIRCRAKDQWEPARLSDKRGRVLVLHLRLLLPGRRAADRSW